MKFIAGFVALLVLIWRVSQWPKWPIRAVIYGWAAIFIWAILWAGILPRSLRGVMDDHTMADAFPNGTIAAAALFTGWFWPAAIVLITKALAAKKKRDSRVE